MAKILFLLQSAAAVAVSVPSFCFVAIARKILIRRRVAKAARGKVSAASYRWRGWSEHQAAPWALPGSMIVHPRWNPHPVQHMAGPCFVRTGIELDAGTMADAAEYWILSVYKDWREVKTVSSTAFTDRPDRIQTDLETGNYVFFIRYYNTAGKGACPEIRIDGIPSIDGCPVEKEAEAYHRFLCSIRNKKGLFYLFLHTHVMTLLHWRKYVGESFVQKSYLPYGNPGTDFKFGLIRKNRPLEIRFDKGILCNALVYIVFLNRYGFPVRWENITAECYTGKPLPETCSFLVRMIRK